VNNYRLKIAFFSISCQDNLNKEDKKNGYFWNSGVDK